MNKQNSTGEKIVLPLLYGITGKELKDKYPFLSNIKYVTTKTGKKKIVDKLLKLIAIKQVPKKLYSLV